MCRTGGNDTERVEDMGVIVPIWKRKGDVHDPRKVQGYHTTQPSTETVGEGFRRKDQEKSRM